MDEQGFLDCLSASPAQKSEGDHQAKAQIMNPVHRFLLTDCFWDLFDTGMPAEQTPLLTGEYDGGPLAVAIGNRFGISADQAALEIAAARSEVEL